ncbi:MAG: lysylphosphatidylglycerol synthase transmembrane domain-containing protein [Magnetospirillum sp.]|nr:lysylphosphatidylglycerol synthase transmembrane domain-containing protein [Magnetospirillum sp.]
MRVKRWLPWLLKGAVSAGLIWWVLSKVDIADAWRTARGMDLGMLAAAAGLWLVQIVLGAVRWGVVLRALSGRFTAWQTLGAYYIGVFFSAVHVLGGDAMRMWYSRRAGLSLQTSVNSVMLERAVTVLGLVLLVALMQPLLLARLPALSGAWVFPLLSLLGCAGLVVLGLLDRLPAALRRWRVVQGLALLAADTRRVFFRLRFGVPALAVAIFGHVNLSLAVYCLARGLGIAVTATDCLVLVPPVILVQTVPITIFGFGVREKAMITAFGLVGVPNESALVLSFLYWLVSTATALPGGLVFFLSGERRLAPDVLKTDKVGA